MSKSGTVRLRFLQRCRQAARSPPGAPTPMGTQQSPAHPRAAGPAGMHHLTSRRAARCREIETASTSHLPTLLIKKQGNVLISCSINTATSSPLLNTHPAQQSFICEYEALTLMHPSWANSAFLSNLGKAEDNLAYFILMLPQALPSNDPLFPWALLSSWGRG